MFDLIPNQIILLVILGPLLVLVARRTGARGVLTSALVWGVLLGLGRQGQMATELWTWGRDLLGLALVTLGLAPWPRRTESTRWPLAVAAAVAITLVGVTAGHFDLWRMGQWTALLPVGGLAMALVMFCSPRSGRAWQGTALAAAALALGGAQLELWAIAAGLGLVLGGLGSLGSRPGFGAAWRLGMTLVITLLLCSATPLPSAMLALGLGLGWRAGSPEAARWLGPATAAAMPTLVAIGATFALMARPGDLSWLALALVAALIVGMALVKWIDERDEVSHKERDEALGTHATLALALIVMGVEVLGGPGTGARIAESLTAAPRISPIPEPFAATLEALLLGAVWCAVTAPLRVHARQR